jgi:hypothetical protein
MQTKSPQAEKNLFGVLAFKNASGAANNDDENQLTAWVLPMMKASDAPPPPPPPVQKRNNNANAKPANSSACRSLNVPPQKVMISRMKNVEPQQPVAVASAVAKPDIVKDTITPANTNQTKIEKNTTSSVPAHAQQQGTSAASQTTSVTGVPVSSRTSAASQTTSVMGVPGNTPRAQIVPSR